MDNEKLTGGGYSLEDGSEQELASAVQEVAGEVKDIEAPYNQAEVPVEVERVTNELSTNEYGEQVEAFSVGMGAIERVFGGDVAGHIKNELTRIDEIQSRTIGALSRTGTLSDESKSIVRDLTVFYGINANNLTVEEAVEVYDYAINATDEIRDKKAHKICDVVSKNIHGVRGRYDGRQLEYQDDEEARIKEELLDKYVAWERGDMEESLEKGFDAGAVYSDLEERGLIDGTALDKEFIETHDIEELAGMYGIDADEYIFKYGPFTQGDLDSIEPYLEKYWTSLTSQGFNAGVREKTRISKMGTSYKEKTYRNGANLKDVINETIKPGTTSIEEDLICDFVADEILQTRRLGTREILMASSALALDILEQNSDEEKNKDVLLTARKTVSYIAGYLVKILYKKEEFEASFGRKGRLSTEFFKEVAEISKNLTELRASCLDEVYKKDFVKIDEHLHDLLDYEAALQDKDNESVQSVYSEELD